MVPAEKSQKHLEEKHRGCGREEKDPTPAWVMDTGTVFVASSSPWHPGIPNPPMGASKEARKSGTPLSVSRTRES